MSWIWRLDLRKPQSSAEHGAEHVHKRISSQGIAKLPKAYLFLIATLCLDLAEGQGPPARTASCHDCGDGFQQEASGRTLEEILVELNRTNPLAQQTELLLPRLGLSGPIPSWLAAEAPRLEVIDLSHNALTGEIPPALASLSKLQTLRLYRNGLSGPVPAELGNLTQLTLLYLYQNSLSGEIPPQLARLSRLQKLSLDSNSLSGPVPPQLGDLTQLTHLNLFKNSLSGEIPPQLARLSRLQKLDLDSNSLSGPVPPQLGDLTQLTVLYLYQNSLSGEIPPQLGELTELFAFIVSSNRLSGTMPPNFFAGLSRLREVWFNWNPLLTGDFPTTEPAVALREIHVGGCGFTGALALGPSVQVVDFSSNRLGALPATWHVHRHLMSLKLDQNEMGGWPRRGVPPRSMVTEPTSKTSLCPWTVVLPPFVWPQLQELDVSSNPIGPVTDAGDFLYSLSYLPRLRVLRARNCRLHGEPQGLSGRMVVLNASDCLRSSKQPGFPSLQSWDMAENLLRAVRVSPPSMLMQANFSFNVLGSWGGATGAAALHRDWWRMTAGSVLQALDVLGNPALQADVLPPQTSNCIRTIPGLAADPATFKPIAAASNAGVGHIECTKPCQLGLNLLVDPFSLNASALCRCTAGTAGANFSCKPCPVGTHAQSKSRFRMHPTCQACPAGSTTLSSGRSSACDCKCDVGSYMTNATLCAVGGSVDPDSMRCRPCGALLTTSRPGATSRDACICDQMRIRNLVDLGSRACGCAEGSYLDLGRAACERCPPGRSAARGAALDGVQGCRVTATFFLLAACYVLAAAGALFALPVALGLLPLRLQDVGLEEGRLVATTSGAHGLLRWRPVLVTFTDTCHPALDFDGKRNPAAFLVVARSGDRLSVLRADGEPETRALDASQGLIRISVGQALLSAGIWRLPAAGIVLLLAPAAAVLEVVWQQPLQQVRVNTAVSLALALAIHLLRLYRGLRTPLAVRHRDFGRRLKDVNPQPHSSPPGAGRGLTAGQLDHLYHFFEHFIGNRDMYYVCSNIVKPLTAPSQLSYADLAGAHQLKWFVSHYWGMSVRHFVEAILKHAKMASTSDWHAEAYWICTFSNNQWRVEEELGYGHWDQSSFYLALRSSACCATLMVVDSEVKPLTRAWCLFEVLQTMQLRQDRPDFAGLLLGTSTGVLNFGQSGMDIAMALASQLATIDVRTAEASNEQDRAMILRLVEGQPGGFDAVNGFLRQEVCDALAATQQRVDADFRSLMQTLTANLPSSAVDTQSAGEAHSHPQAAQLQGDDPLEDPASPMAKPWEGPSGGGGRIWPHALAGAAAAKWRQARCRWLRIGAQLLIVVAVAAFGMDLTVELA